MKKLMVLFLLAFCGQIAFAQLSATTIYKNTVKSTVTIETDIGLGSGFFVAPNIIATNYHVVAGATVGQCKTNDSDKKYKIEGYVAVDKSVDLILLKVAELNRPAIKLAASPKVEIGQKVYAIGSPKGLDATISDGIVSGLRDFEGHKLLQITAAISPGSSGGPVLNNNGELIGIAVAQVAEGQNLNFAIPKSYLELLLSFKKQYALPLTSLKDERAPSSPPTPTKFGKNKRFELKVYMPDKPELTLDYVANEGEYTYFLFTYTHKNSQYTSQSIWLDDYYLVDIDTKKRYKADWSNLGDKNKPRVLYNGTSTQFYVRFRGLPTTLRQFNLAEGECAENNFCFINVDINNYKEISTIDGFKWYTLPTAGGTVTFYQNQKKIGNIDIFIEGSFAGTLTQYFTEPNFVPECGNATKASLTLRLPVGSYNFTAKSQTNNKYQWSGRITITENGCLPFRLYIK